MTSLLLAPQGGPERMSLSVIPTATKPDFLVGYPLGESLASKESRLILIEERVASTMMMRVMETRLLSLAWAEP